HAADGSLLVVWETGNSSGANFEIFGQRYESSRPIGVEFRVNTYTSYVQHWPQIAGSRGGSGPSYVVVWTSFQEDGDGGGVFAQRYAAGTPLGSEFQVNTETMGHDAPYDVSLDGSGNAVVVWDQPDADGVGVYGRRYSSAGAPLTGAFRVNTNTIARE